MFQMSQPTLDSSIGQFPPSKYKELCKLLRQGAAWKELACVIRNRQNTGPRFTSDDILEFELYTDPAEMLLKAWSTDHITYQKLIDALHAAGLVRQAEFVRQIVGSPLKCGSEVTNGCDADVIPPPNHIHPERPHDFVKSKAYQSIPNHRPLKICHPESSSPLPKLEEVKLLTHSDLNAPKPLVGLSKNERAKSDLRKPSKLAPIPRLPPFRNDDPVSSSNQLCYSVLGQWTNNFDIRHIHVGGTLLGQGGYADVFRGYDPISQQNVAVKRLKIKVSADNADDDSHNPRQQFENEIQVLTGCRHENVVRLIGFSTDGPFRCIVYEFLSGGSLEDRLACRNSLAALTAEQRLRVARDTARGLVYLHTEKKLIHMDVKSANILLDDSLRAKVGDYGITRHGPSTPGATSTHTKFIIGTTVYMAPELLTGGRVSEKVDAYSFGVVLLELLTGLPALDTNREEQNLVSHVAENCDDELTILDRRAGDWSCVDPQHVYRLACKLTEQRHAKRPKITEVQDEIESFCDKPASHAAAADI